MVQTEWKSAEVILRAVLRASTAKVVVKRLLVRLVRLVMLVSLSLLLCLDNSGGNSKAQGNTGIILGSQILELRVP